MDRGSCAPKSFEALRDVQNFVDARISFRQLIEARLCGDRLRVSLMLRNVLGTSLESLSTSAKLNIENAADIP